MNRSHCAFCGRDYCELRVRSNIARCIHSLNTRLACVIYPYQIAFGIQSTAEFFVKVSGELRSEVKEQRVALERLTFRKKNTLQLPR